MDILDVLANWARWIFDAFGVNAILKKIARLFTNNSKRNTKSGPNALVNPDMPQSWNL